MSQTDYRSLNVPEGLAGERVDAAMARMFGLSRSRAAELISPQPRAGRRQRGRQERPGDAGGSLVEVSMPVEADPLVVVPQVVEGIKIIHDDDSIVVIDKPVGVAVHPSPGWKGPTVVAHLAGAGFRIATSGAWRRSGDNVSTWRAAWDVVAVVGGRAHCCSRKPSAPHGRARKIADGAGRTRDRLGATVARGERRHPGANYKFAVIDGGRASVTHYETLEMHRYASLLEVHLETGRTHQIRVHMAALKHPCVGDIARRRPDPRQAPRADPPVAARRPTRVRAPGHR